MDLQTILLVLTPVLGAIVSYAVYLHKCLNEVDARLDVRYTKPETEHLIDLKIKPLNERTMMLEDRLERLERKIDRILEKVSRNA